MAHSHSTVCMPFGPYRDQPIADVPNEELDRMLSGEFHFTHHPHMRDELEQERNRRYSASRMQYLLGVLNCRFNALASSTADSVQQRCASMSTKERCNYIQLMLVQIRHLADIIVAGPIASADAEEPGRGYELTGIARWAGEWADGGER